MSVDRNTMTRLLLTMRGKVIGYISSIVGDPHLAEDVFQDVTIICLEKASTLDGDDAVTPWVFKTARFQALNAFRKRKRGAQPFDDAVLDLLDGEWMAGTEDPVDSDRVAALRACLGKLPERSRRLMELRYAENYSGRRLADMMKKPVNTVYVTMSRIYKGLAKCIEGTLARQGLVNG